MEKIPRLTTLCYLEKDGKYLMLHRTKKEHDENGDKWIGVGGKFEYGETPEECAMREVKEETGLTMINPSYRGLITFISDEWGVVYMHLFTCTDFTGDLIECDEGDLVWLPKEELLEKKLWEGDKLFLRALDERNDFFTLKLRYEGEDLVESAFGFDALLGHGQVHARKTFEDHVSDSFAGHIAGGRGSKVAVRAGLSFPRLRQEGRRTP